MKAVLILALFLLIPGYAGAEHESHGAVTVINVLIGVFDDLEQITSRVDRLSFAGR